MSYAQRYIDALLDRASLPGYRDAVTNLGEINASTAKQPHVAVFMQLAPHRFLATTAGVSGRPMPLPVSSGLQYFELCALTAGHSPQILWLLSNVANFILGSLSPFFYGSDEQRAWVIAETTRSGAAPEPRPFLPYQTILLGGSGDRLLLVPRWRFDVPQGPPVEVVEPLPLIASDFAVLDTLSLAEREGWVRALGDATLARWDRFIPARGEDHR